MTINSKNNQDAPDLKSYPKKRILVISGPFPSKNFPTYGIFVKERVKALASMQNIEVLVVSPVPYFPPIKSMTRWYRYSQFPREEEIDGLRVIRPRYLHIPKISGYFASDLIYHSIKRTVDKIQADFKFDLIDAHFVYPSGVVGARLGKRYNLPVIMTGRGEDMIRFPDYPVKGDRIRWAIQNGDRFVALSDGIAESFKKNGASSEKISIIPNGVDIEKFNPVSLEEARKRLGLPLNGKVILAVGERLELKGFHLLVEALPQIQKVYPDTKVVIVGGHGRHGTDYTKEIEAKINELDLKDSVILAGRVLHDELPFWYSAADVSVLLSSREGSPNVVLEALSCGTPVVATAVGSIPYDLKNPTLGIVLPDRSASSAADTIIKQFSQSWDREKIRHIMTSRTWESVAKKLINILP